MRPRLYVAGRAGRYGRAGARWARLLVARRTSPGVRVFYGHDRVPGLGERAAGGTAKMQKLAARFPNSPTDFTVLYLGSNWLPRDLRLLLSLARRRNVPIVVNQDGVGYPGWAGSATEEVNRPLRRAILAADHVLYQSEFSKRSADEFLGPPRGSWEILHNAVDVEAFAPAERLPADGPILLLGGDQTQSYRIELALKTLADLVPALPGARLMITGRLVASAQAMARALGVESRIDLVGEYAQRDAPTIFRRAHILLHTKVNDPCPTLVIEAMACGLPVVFPASGGTIELVGGEGGIGVAHPDSFDRDDPPSSEALAEAVTILAGDLPRYATGARRRAVEHFALGPWLDRHAALFAGLKAEAGEANQRPLARPDPK